MGTTNRSISNNPDVAGTLATGDNEILAAGTGERFDITHLDFHNQDTVSRSVSLYYSADDTSAAGKLFDVLTMSPGETVPSFAGLGGLNSGKSLVAVPSVAAKILPKITYDKLTGSAADV